MASQKQVSCINKKGDHYDPHERIGNIGGVYKGTRWTLAESSAIFNIKEGLEGYNVIVNGKAVYVIIEKHSGREHLKTKTDNYKPDNLLSLPECPAW